MRPLTLLLTPGTVALLLIGVNVAAADVGPPAHLQISEREPGLFAVRWRVPTVLPQRAVPTPHLPAGCAPAGDVVVTSQAGAWLFEQNWRCDGALTGQEIGLDFPFADLALTTVARVELLSGDRFAHLLTPGDPPWRLPAGTVAPDLVAAARDAVWFGVVHAATSWAHLALVLAIALLGRGRRPLWLLSAVSGGQVVGLLAPAVVGFAAPAPVAGLALGLAAALLAREALRPADERHSVYALVAVAGAIHGTAIAGMMSASLGEDAVGFVPAALAVLGMDAAQLAVAYLLFLLLHTGRRAEYPAVHRAPAQVAGALGAAVALAAALSGAPAGAGDSSGRVSFEQTGGQALIGGPTASQRVAPSAPDVALQSFITIEPFEVRHEAMVRLGALAGAWGLDVNATLEIEAQQPLAQEVGELVLQHTALTVDDQDLPAVLRRVDFMAVDATGALPRATPQPEPVAEAVLGVVVSYPTGGMPQRVSLAWVPFPEVVSAIPVTVIDPESVRSETLSRDEATLAWDNELLDDPIPTLNAVPIEPQRVPLPLLSLPLLLVAGVAVARGARGEHRAEAFALGRVLLAVALMLGPLAAPTLAVPGSTGRLPSEAQARRLLAGLLPNVYRALEFREEGRIYDRLAITVTGDTLTEIYLQQRRALELEERGGAQARVQAVEVLETSDVASQADGFTVRAQWVVGGMVTHFGHRHFRQNRYDARIGVAAVDGTWKIRTIEVLEQERVQ